MNFSVNSNFFVAAGRRFRFIGTLDCESFKYTQPKGCGYKRKEFKYAVGSFLPTVSFLLKSELICCIYHLSVIALTKNSS